MLRFRIRKDDLSGDITMTEGKIIYMESGFLNSD